MPLRKQLLLFLLLLCGFLALTLFQRCWHCIAFDVCGGVFEELLDASREHEYIFVALLDEKLGDRGGVTLIVMVYNDQFVFFVSLIA